MTEAEKFLAKDWDRFKGYEEQVLRQVADQDGVTSESLPGRLAIQMVKVLGAMEVLPAVAQALESISVEKRFDFQQSARSLILAATVATGFTLTALKSGTVPDEIADRLNDMEVAALALAEILDKERPPRSSDAVRRVAYALMGVRESEASRAGDDLQGRSVADALRDHLLRLAAITLTTRRNVTPPEEDPSKDVGNAARMRRFRDRHRRRVAFSIQMEVYDDDLDLLTRLGFLSGHEKGDKQAVEKAMESFVLYAFLNLPDPAVPLKDRLQRQRGRLRSVSGRRV